MVMPQSGGHPRQLRTSEQFRVLFLCTHNSARSQLAEAILRARTGEQFDVASAGSDPGETVHPLASEIISQIGGDPNRHKPKGVEEVMGQDWDLVITVCDKARETCPALPERTVSAHWGVDDPVEVDGTLEEKRAAFRAAQKILTKRIDLFLSLGPEKIERLVLRDRMGRLESPEDG